jgi:hypothetical protein
VVPSEKPGGPWKGELPPRYLLPHDVSGALTISCEVDPLLAAIVDEVKRRGQRTPVVVRSVANQGAAGCR